MSEIVVFEAPDGAVRVEVRLDRETVWLTQQQMAELFGRERSVVTKHIRNAFGEGELDPGATSAKFAQVRTEGEREVQREVDHYNLDVIISVGYRVKSLRGTQFRIWATRTLRDHVLRGYTINERRLRERGLAEIEQAVGLLAKTLTARALVTDEGRAVLDVVQRYTQSWRLLLEYDENRLSEGPTRPLPPTARLTLPDAREAAARLREDLLTRGEAGTLFGQEKATPSRRFLALLSRLSTACCSTRACRRALCTCSTSSSRIIRSRTATSATERCCSWSTCGATTSC